MPDAARHLRPGRLGRPRLPAPRAPERPSLGPAALEHARITWPVFRLRSGGKTPLIPTAHPEGDPLAGKCRGQCGQDGHGHLDATTDAATIERWWAETPNANIGMPTGSASGIVVLDVDHGEAGEATLAELEAKHGPLPPTLTARTPGDSAQGKAPGRQLYFAHPGGRIKTGAGELSGLGPHLDVRGDGGYVVLPPSRRPDGAYRWADPEAPVAELPASWAALLRAGPKSERVEPPDGAGQGPTTAYGAIPLEQEAAEVAATPEGERRTRLNTAAFRLGQLAVAGEVNADEAAARLLEAATTAGLPAGEARRTVRSGLRDGMTKPRPEAETAPPAVDVGELLGDVNARRAALGNEPLPEETLALARDTVAKMLAMADAGADVGGQQDDRPDDDRGAEEADTPPPPPADGQPGGPGQGGEGAAGEQASGPPPKGRWLRATSASAITPRPVRWLWAVLGAGRIPEGMLTLLGGREGIGKSILAYTLAALVTRGELPGRHRGTPRTVVVAATEDSWAHVIVPRLMAAGADLERVVRVEAVEVVGGDELHGPLVLPKDLVALGRLLVGTDAALLLLDPLISRLDAKLDTHKSAEVRRALEPLTDLLDRCGVAALGLIHVTKGSSTDPLTLLVASRAFAEVARAALFVMVDPDDRDRRLLGQPKNNVGRTDLPTLVFAIEEAVVAVTEEGQITAGRLVWIGERQESVHELLEAAREDAQVRTAVGEAASWLDDYLLAHGGRVASADVKREGKAAGHSETSLSRACRRLRLLVESEGFPRVTYWRRRGPIIEPPGESTP
jgi:Bifunctional DNA primase/polymerase, N-terminal/AAA domain